MPCTDWDTTPRTADGGSSYANLTAQVDQQKVKIDSLTNMLCQVCRHVEEAVVSDQYDYEELKGNLPKEVWAWWDQHKKMDTQRLKAEAKAKRFKELKEGALAKLSKEERKALGL